MKRNWKSKAAALLAASGALLISACGSAKQGNTVTSDTAAQQAQTEISAPAGGQALSIVCTSYPQYDFVNQILGDNPAGAEVTYLLGSGVDMHNYQASADDMIKIRTSDLFLYMGGESDAWAEDVVSQVEEDKFHALALIDTVEAKQEEIVEGMENDEESHNHGTAVFEDSEVKDRSLTDWAGTWQSVYPFLLDGTLDEVMEHKAEESEEKTAEDYYNYYKTGYETAVEGIVIDGNSVEFIENGNSVKAEYEYKGYEILTYESGNKGVRYQFEAVGDPNGAPGYIQFSDHLTAPEKAEHFHLYSGNDGFDELLTELENWPTYYPGTMTGKEIADDMVGHDHGEEGELDEHVWLSIKNSMVISNAICDMICELDPENGDLYRENAAAYNSSLAALDHQYEQAVGSAPNKVIMVADRFPFRYLADDYGLTYYAAFPGCSAETEASFETIVFLAEKLSELKLPVVFDIDGSDGTIAKTVIENSSDRAAKIKTLNSLQSVSQADIEAGASYIKIMEENLEVLKEALK